MKCHKIDRFNLTEPDSVFDIYPSVVQQSVTSSSDIISKKHTALPEQPEISSGDDVKESSSPVPPVIITSSDDTLPMTSQQYQNKVDVTVAVVIKSLIDYLSGHSATLWNYEDITAKVWTIKSAEQIDVLLQHILKIFQFSLPNAHINERWAQTALQLGLSCSSRHYAGRSLQIFRALRVPITSRMLSDILSRLVETVAEQGEDMQGEFIRDNLSEQGEDKQGDLFRLICHLSQRLCISIDIGIFLTGYVTELLLTLEAAVESLESDFRPLDFMKDFFKSTPNLNNKDMIKLSGHENGGVGPTAAAIFNHSIQAGHGRSTSYSVSYGFRKNNMATVNNNDASSVKERKQDGGEHGRKFTPSSNLSRSRSAQSLKLLGDSANQDDKLTILAQLFWLAVSLLESDYEHEFLLAVGLLARVMHRLPLDRPDARDKVEKLQAQLRWNSFPGVHALLLKVFLTVNFVSVVNCCRCFRVVLIQIFTSLW